MRAHRLDFSLSLVNRLHTYGKLPDPDKTPALWALLQLAYPAVGFKQQEQIDGLKDAVFAAAEFEPSVDLPVPPIDQRLKEAAKSPIVITRIRRFYRWLRHHPLQTMAAFILIFALVIAVFCDSSPCNFPNICPFPERRFCGGRRRIRI